MPDLAASLASVPTNLGGNRNRRLTLAILLLLPIAATGLVLRFRKGNEFIDVSRLRGRVLFIRQDRGGRDAPSDRVVSRVAVMNANGTSSRVLLSDFDHLVDLIWYPGLKSIGFLNPMITSGLLRPGLYSAKVNGSSAQDTSISSVKLSLPDDFKARVYNPSWTQLGGDTRLVPDSPDTRVYSTRITFSPDGRSIAAIVSFILPGLQQYDVKMCVISVQDNDIRNCDETIRPCEGMSPVWSPDGSKVVFAGALKEDVSSCNLVELYLSNSNMQGTVQLTNIDGPRMTKRVQSEMVKPAMRLEFWHKSSYPKWSPDGDWIAFMSYGGIYRIHPNGTGCELIIRNGYYPEWSPDGTMVMYVVIAGSPFATSGPSDRIFVAHADGSDPTEIVLDNKISSKSSYRDLNWTE